MLLKKELKLSFRRISIKTYQSDCPGSKHDALFIQKNLIRVKKKKKKSRLVHVGKTSISFRHFNTKRGLVPNPVITSCFVDSNSEAYIIV